MANISGDLVSWKRVSGDGPALIDFGKEGDLLVVCNMTSDATTFNPTMAVAFKLGRTADPGAPDDPATVGTVFVKADNDGIVFPLQGENAYFKSTDIGMFRYLHYHADHGGAETPALVFALYRE